MKNKKTLNKRNGKVLLYKSKVEIFFICYETDMTIVLHI